MDEARTPGAGVASRGAASRLRRHIDPAVAWAFGCIVLVLLVGSLYSRSFLSPEYLLQQLKVASFLGIIATGAMIVILLGQIDLSVPWVVAVGGMMATAATGWGPAGEALAIPIGVACGVVLGLVNGLGVAVLRLPSMVVTLAVNAVAQGLMVVHTGGFSPQASSSPAMRFLATGDTLLAYRMRWSCGQSSARARRSCSPARRSAARSTRSATGSARPTCPARGPAPS
jgi:ribose transport system permease protein